MVAAVEDHHLHAADAAEHARGREAGEPPADDQDALRRFGRRHGGRGYRRKRATGASPAAADACTRLPYDPGVPRGVDREGFQRRFLLLAVAIVSLLFLWMIRSFLIAGLLAALAAALLGPVYRWLAARLGGRQTLAAALTVLLTLALLIVPATGLLGMVVGQAVEVTQRVTPWVQEQIANPDEVTRRLLQLPFADRIEALLPERERVLEGIGNAVSAMSSVLVDGVAAAGRMTATFFLQLFIMLYALFFFLMDGAQVMDRIRYYLPLEEDDENELIERFVSVTRATLKGSLMIGGIQGLLAGLAFWAAGIHGAAFWGTVMMVLSVIPGVGAPLIWVPAAVWLFATGQTAAGIGLTAWCGVVVGSVDNVLRPRLVGNDAKMSDLMILLSTLGGITLFGAVGFVLGPIVAAVFVTIWEVYGRAFAHVLPSARAAEPPVAPLLDPGPEE
jgi:predicted PurR-regulated permease PerM